MREEHGYRWASRPPINKHDMNDLTKEMKDTIIESLAFILTARAQEYFA